MYDYKDLKSKIFTDEGQKEFLKVRDNVFSLLAKSGAVSMDKAMSAVTGDTWTSMSYVDRMVELGEIREINIPNAMGQHRVFIKGL